METRYGMNPKDVDHYTKKELWNEWVLDKLFVDDSITATLTHVDRSLIGGAVPTTKEVCFDDFIDAGEDLGVEYVLARREVGCMNIGGPGYVLIDGERYDVGNMTAIYIGRESKNVTFGSVSYDEPARFYYHSAPAHTKYPNRVITQDMAVRKTPGSMEESNQRVVLQYILPSVCDCCQLLMGWIQVQEGSVWSAMPTHTHERRTETYMYFNMTGRNRVIHLMGEPTNSFHLIMDNEQAVVAPAWSIHTGVGSSDFGFIFSMAGENQTFPDAKPVFVDQMF